MYEELRQDSQVEPPKEKRYRSLEGPWTNEPDCSQWFDADTGLPCLARRGPLGSWCGYVGSYPGHPLHGVPYSDRDWTMDTESPDSILQVHGGITYSNECAGDICHDPHPCEPHPVWWFGFDCAHVGDLVPEMFAGREPGGRMHAAGFANTDSVYEDDVYRDLDYVREECASLAAQLYEIHRPPRWREASEGFAQRASIATGVLIVGLVALGIWLAKRVLF